MKLELTLSNDTSVMQDTNSIDKQFSAKSTCDNKSSKNIIHLRIDNVKWFLRPVTRLPFRYQSRACFISKPMSKGFFFLFYTNAPPINGRFSIKDFFFFGHMVFMIIE